MKIGIMGTGRMAETMCNAISRMPEAEVTAVGSRSLENALAFSRKNGIKHAYPSYDALLSDPELDLIYIATPPSHHYEAMRLCLTYNKNTLCEKTFTANACEAEAIMHQANDSSILLAEAIWTRYMPSREIIKSIIDSGELGDVFFLTANLSYPVTYKERVIRPELAGGALLDVGVYPLNFALMAFGENASVIGSQATFLKTGVDASNSFMLNWENGRTAVLSSDVRISSDRNGTICGDKGYMVVQNINNPEAVHVYNMDHKLKYSLTMPAQTSGYEYEIIACQKAILSHEKECPEMPHTTTVHVMKLLDEIRSMWNANSN